MRVVVILAGLAAVGCTSEHELQFRSTVVTESDGVALSDDGLTSYAAMNGLTCALDVRWGCPTIEDDLPTDEEQVLDHLDGTTLAASASTLHFMEGGSWDPSRDLAVPSLRTARLSDAGLLALHDDDGCQLDIGSQTMTVDDAFCSATDLEVDRRGALVAITEGGVLRADASGVTRLAEGGDRGAVDLSQDLVYVATAGDYRLTAVDGRGAEQWSVDLDNPVRDVAARGDKGDVIVLSENAEGLGVIERRDGLTGEVESLGTVPVADAALRVSANGRTLALVTEGEISHFEIVIEGEKVPLGEEVTCLDLPVPQSPGVGFD